MNQKITMRMTNVKDTDTTAAVDVSRIDGTYFVTAPGSTPVKPDNLPAMPLEPLTGDKYRHFKGGEYRVYNLAWDLRHSRWDVVYLCLKDYLHWVRSHDEFVGSISRDGYQGPRFVREN